MSTQHSEEAWAVVAEAEDGGLDFEPFVASGIREKTAIRMHVANFLFRDEALEFIKSLDPTLKYSIQRVRISTIGRKGVRRGK